MSVWKSLYVSLLSPVKIADLLSQKKRKLVLYFSLLILLCLIPTLVATTQTISGGVSNFQEFMKSDEVPDFQLKKGVLTSDRTEPYIGKIDGSTIIFDTTGTFDVEKVRAEKAEFAILKDRLVMTDKTSEDQLLYSELAGVEFSKRDLTGIIDFLAGMKWLAIVFVLFVVYVFQYCKLLILALLIGLIGLALNSSLQTGLRYGRLWVLAGYSMTIPTVVSWFLYSVSLSIPFSGILYLVACSVILYFVLREISRRAQQPSQPQETVDTGTGIQ